MQHAVDPEPDAHVVFVRLDVNVTRAALNGRQENGADQPDDWGVGLLFQASGVDLVRIRQHLQTDVGMTPEIFEDPRDEIGFL